MEIKEKGSRQKKSTAEMKKPKSCSFTGSWKLELTIKHKLSQIPRKIGINAIFPIQYGMIFRVNILHILANFNDMFTYTLHINFRCTRNSHARHIVLQHIFFWFGWVLTNQCATDIFSNRFPSSFNKSIVFLHMEVP